MAHTDTVLSKQWHLHHLDDFISVEKQYNELRLVGKCIIKMMEAHSIRNRHDTIAVYSFKLKRLFKVDTKNFTIYDLGHKY